MDIVGREPLVEGGTTYLLDQAAIDFLHSWEVADFKGAPTVCIV